MSPVLRHLARGFAAVCTEYASRLVFFTRIICIASPARPGPARPNRQPRPGRTPARAHSRRCCNALFALQGITSPPPLTVLHNYKPCACNIARCGAPGRPPLIMLYNYTLITLYNYKLTISRAAGRLGVPPQRTVRPATNRCVVPGERKEPQCRATNDMAAATQRELRCGLRQGVAVRYPALCASLCASLCNERLCRRRTRVAAQPRAWPHSGCCNAQQSRRCVRGCRALCCAMSWHSGCCTTSCNSLHHELQLAAPRVAHRAATRAATRVAVRGAGSRAGPRRHAARRGNVAWRKRRRTESRGRPPRTWACPPSSPGGAACISKSHCHDKLALS
jgi:hypothetical protein